MERNEILKKVNDVFIVVLDNDSIVLTDTTTADEVEDWDSLNHIHLVLGVEKAFKVRFTSHEIQSWKNVGELINTIKVKL